MIVLPDNAVAILRDKPEKKESLIIYENKDEPDINTGTIIYTGEKLKEYQGCFIKFRENFVEEQEIEGKVFVFARDLQSSMVYVIK